jgi:acyl carrier protein
MTGLDVHAHLAAALAAIAPDIDPTADIDADLHDDLGLDSMDLVNLAAEVARRTGIDIPERDYGSLRTTRQLEVYLTARAVRADQGPAPSANG